MRVNVQHAKFYIQEYLASGIYFIPVKTVNRQLKLKPTKQKGKLNLKTENRNWEEQIKEKMGE